MAAANRDALEVSRGRRRSISVDSTHKRTRLIANDNLHDVPLHRLHIRHASSHAQLSASAAPPASHPAGFLVDFSNSSGYTTSRQPDQNTKHFTSSILNPPQAGNPPSEAPPSSWSPRTHLSTFPSPRLVSPIVGSSFPRRDSAYSNGNPRPPSPSAASSSSKGDSVRASYPPIHANGQRSSSVYGIPTQSYGAAQQQNGTSTNRFAVPFALPHRPFSMSDAKANSNTGGYRTFSLPYVADSHTSISRAAAQKAARTVPPPYTGPEFPLPFSTDAVHRHFQQDVTHTNYAQTHMALPSGSFSPAFGAWTRGLSTYPRPLSAVSSMHSPAAPLHSILHPVDQSPKMENVEISVQQDTDGRVRPNTPSGILDSKLQTAPPSVAPSVVSNGSSTTSWTAARKTQFALKNENEIQIVPPLVDDDFARSGQSHERRWKVDFTVDQRNETIQTRVFGACLRCKSQRVRCVPSPLGPLHPCLTCEQVSKSSKKVLHKIRCVRWRMVAMTTHRNGGLNLTQRWDGTTVQDVGDWEEIKTYEIAMKLFYTSHMHRYDLCDVPIKFRVRRFKPIDGDILTRKWTKRVTLADGTIATEKRYIQLPPYALADANATIEIFKDYFETNALDTMLHVAKYSHPIVRKHLEAAVEHCKSLPDGDVEKSFMQKFIKLWFCARFTTGTDYISGTEKLGCHPVTDPDYPLGERISVPRMVTAQCDSIMVSRLLRPLTQDLIPEFEKTFRIGNPDNWFTLYVSTFILLSEISFSCQDRRRHAQENWLKQKYTLPEYVGELQFGANIILCYWHYYRTMDPMDESWDVYCKIIDPPTEPRAEIESAKGKGKKRVHLTRSQYELVTSHWKSMVETANMMDNKVYRESFEHPLYFASQMFVTGWQMRDHYKRGPIEEHEGTT